MDKLTILSKINTLLFHFSKAERSVQNHLESTKEILNILLPTYQSLPVIHIAGTKGKTSTCTFLRNIILNSGLRVGTFTSPHVQLINERIVVGKNPILLESMLLKLEALVQSLSLVHKSRLGSHNITFFQLLFVLALQYFVENNLDYIIIETGIGGLYDTTNIFDHPRVVGITSIGYDHQNLLGHTIEEITHQKIGIFKSNSKVLVSAYQTHFPILYSLVLERAKALDCDLRWVEPNSGIQEHLSGYAINQVHNASLAIEMARALGLEFSSNSLLEPVAIVGRCHRLIDSRNNEWFLDGSHTIESIEASCIWFLEKRVPGKKNILVFGITGNRDPKKLLEPVVQSCMDIELLICTNFTGKYGTCCSTKDLITSWNQLGGNPACANTANTCQEALDTIDTQTPANILVFGSLYLVGEILNILEKRTCLAN